MSYRTQLFYDVDEVKQALSSFQNGYQRQALSDGIQKDAFHCGIGVYGDEELKSIAVLYHNPQLELNGKAAWCLGNFESIYDTAAAKRVFDRAVEECSLHNIGVLIGPMNGSTWNNYRFRLEPFNEVPAFMSEPDHQRFYPSLWESFFSRSQDYFSAIAGEPDYFNPRHRFRRAELEQLGVRFRSLDVSNLEEELDKLYDFNAVAFASNFLYSRIQREAFVLKYLSMKAVLKPEMVRIAESNSGEIVGFVLAFADVYAQEGKRLVVKTLARSKDTELKGLGAVLLDDLFSGVQAHGFNSVIHAFMIDDGLSTPVSAALGGRKYCSYRLYYHEF
ncbi:MAG: hypothetical protein ACOYLH_03665 [Flavobacteriales bacterium]